MDEWRRAVVTIQVTNSPTVSHAENPNVAAERGGIAH
jgi:hypothetical protein